MRALATIIATSVFALVAATPSAGSAAARTCGFIRASVPYTPHGTAERWRVYVEGEASCASAVSVLYAVMHGEGRQHVGKASAGSYTTFGGWLCPYGQMGTQTCELPQRLPSHPPIRARALARNCAQSDDGCPARVPSSDL